MRNLLLSAIVIFSLTVVAEENEMKLEPLLGYMHDSKGLVFQVFSGGCTSKDSFVIQHENHESEQFVVSLIRKSPDYCRAYFPYGLLIYFSYQELGIKNDQMFTILNQVQPSHRGNY